MAERFWLHFYREAMLPSHPCTLRLSYYMNSATKLLIQSSMSVTFFSPLIFRVLQMKKIHDYFMQDGAIERPPLWSSGQSFWLQIQRSAFDSRRYQIFWEVVGLERSPLSLVSTIEELLDRKSSGSDLEVRKYSHRKLRWLRNTLLSAKVGTNFASKWRSLGQYN
jgi:hypothetical protein